MDKSNKGLAENALDIDSLLAVVGEHLHKCVSGESTRHDGAYYQGLVIAVESARRNARYLNEKLDRLECDLLQKLTDEQLLNITHLLEDVVEGNTDARHVSDNGAPRLALARFEAATADMEPEECAAAFSRMDFDVTQKLAADDGNSYIVSKTWSLKGLRHDLAYQRFVDSIMYSTEDQTAWEAIAR